MLSPAPDEQATGDWLYGERSVARVPTPPAPLGPPQGAERSPGRIVPCGMAAWHMKQVPLDAPVCWPFVWATVLVPVKAVEWQLAQKALVGM